VPRGRFFAPEAGICGLFAAQRVFRIAFSAFRFSGNFPSGGELSGSFSEFSGCVPRDRFFAPNAVICGLFAAWRVFRIAFRAFRISGNFPSGGAFSGSFSGISGSVPRGRFFAPDAGIRGFLRRNRFSVLLFRRFGFRFGGSGPALAGVGLRGTRPFSARRERRTTGHSSRSFFLGR